MAIQQIIKTPSKWGFVPSVKARLKLMELTDKSFGVNDRNYSVNVDYKWFRPILITNDPISKMDQALHVPTLTVLRIQEVNETCVVDYESINGQIDEYVKVIAEMKQFSRKQLKAISNKDFEENDEVYVQCKELQIRGHSVSSNSPPIFPSDPKMLGVYYLIWYKPWVTLFKLQIAPFFQS